MNNIKFERKLVTKKVIANYIAKERSLYSTDEDFISDTINYLEHFGMNLSIGDRFLTRVYKGIIKHYLFEKFGNEPMFVTNIEAVYPNKYPINLSQSVNKFKQYEVVIDNTEYKKPIGIVLDIFDGVYKGDTTDFTQEIRLDTNGVMCDEYVSKLTLDKFMSKFDHSHPFHIRLLRGLLLGEQEFVACGCKNGYMVGLSTPTSYTKARLFKGSQMNNETFEIVPNGVYQSYPNKL